jgi:alpha-L-fucosidase 2
MQISPKGYLQEWLEDYEEEDPQHRHVSHLYALHPSNQISPVTTPELAEAAKMTLNRRGDEGTGWSRAWKINFWARLHDGNRAYKLLKSLLVPAGGSNTQYIRGAGTYPNLFCAHPPFQIDGNFGGTAGIAEMLIQSHDGYIHLLPALPDNWSEGNFRGLRVRGGAEVDASWKQNMLKRIEIRATADHTFRIKMPDHITTVTMKGKELSDEDGFILIPLQQGEKVTLRFT